MDTAAALDHFSSRLAFETDVADVAAALAADEDPGFVLLDARSPRSYEAGHLPGARLLPRPFAAADVEALGDALLVVYCWGPACNGATKAARELAALGRPVKEMIGGFEYWERDGHAVERGAAAPLPTFALTTSSTNGTDTASSTTAKTGYEWKGSHRRK